MHTIAALLVLSGAAALLLQVLWARDFALVLGATATGTAVVLAAFFAGLMIGAEIGGRIARPRSSLWTFATLEAGVGLTTLAYVLLVRPSLGELALALPPPLQVFLAPAVLLVPTTLIGATLPAALAALSRRDASTTARLYAWNTLGGAAGALGSLVTLYFLGTRGSFLCAAALDFGVAIVAFALARRTRGASAPSELDSRQGEASATKRTNERSLGRAAAVTGLVGFAALADEVLWTRGLAGVLSNSVYSIALVLAAVLLGLVAGAGLAARLIRGRIQLASWLALACAGLALTTLASRVALAGLPSAATSLAFALEVRGATSGLAVEMLLGLLVVFVPALFLGAIFPLCVALAGGETSSSLGRLLAANTAGGLLGAPVAAFVLLPVLGLGGGLAATAALAALAALIASGLAPVSVRVVAVSTVAVVAVIALLFPTQHLAWRGHYGAERLLLYRDGPAATVMVTSDARGGKRLLANGQYSLGGTDGILLERRQAHVPLLLHPDPEHVLVLGVGTGVTLGAAVAHPGVEADGVEIVPEVLDAAELFADENGHVLENERARITVEDARVFLLASREDYDVILSDLFLPWTAGTAHLYSRELFALARDHLRPGGLFCQWLPLHQLGLSDLQSIVATFLEVFPHASLWIAYHRSTAPIAALVGSPEPLAFDGERLRARLGEPSLARSLRAVGLEQPEDLSLLYVTGADELRAATRAVPPIDDDRPHLELSAPAAYFHQSGLAAENVRWLATLIGEDAGGRASSSVRANALAAQSALLEGNGPAELRAYLTAFQERPEIRTLRRALLAIGRARLAAGDSATAQLIADAMQSLAPESEESVRLADALTPSAFKE